MGGHLLLFLADKQSASQRKANFAINAIELVRRSKPQIWEMPIRALRRRHGRLETLGCELGIVRVGSVVLCIDDTGALVASGGFRLWIQADSHQRRFFDILAAPPVCRRLIHTAGILTNCAARSKASRRCSNLVSIRSSLFGQPQIMSANRANARVHVGRSGSESYRRLLRPGHESSPVSSARPPSSSTRAPKRFTSTSGKSSPSNHSSEMVVSVRA